MPKNTEPDAFSSHSDAFVLTESNDTEMSEQQLGEMLRIGQNRLLEMIATDAPLDETLDSLMRLIESQSQGVVCSVLLLDKTGKYLLHGAAPSLPKAYCDAIHGTAIGANVGSCGTAAYLRKQIIVTDISTDELWANYAELAESFDLRACWSTPIISFQGRLLGTFAMYYRRVREPGNVEVGLIDVATHIAGIAIDRRDKELELKRYSDSLETLVIQRTAELRTAKELAETRNDTLSRVNQDLNSALDHLKVAQSELVSQGKMAALGALVAGVAHELNTPIGNALMASSTLLDSTLVIQNDFLSGSLLKSNLHDYVKTNVEAANLIANACDRAASLISSFKQVAVDQSSEQCRRFNLRTLVEDNIAALRPSFKRVPWVIDVDIPDSIDCHSYPGPLGQVISNLVQNAMKHAFDGRSHGTLSITARINGHDVELSFSDDGHGMESQVLARIFEPFFTTRLGQGGSGLGLSISSNIVTGVLGGKLKASSQPGHGARFVVVFPLARSSTSEYPTT